VRCGGEKLTCNIGAPAAFLSAINPGLTAAHKRGEPGPNTQHIATKDFFERPGKRSQEPPEKIYGIKNN
jgi:hypothetical protein